MFRTNWTETELNDKLDGRVGRKAAEISQKRARSASFRWCGLDWNPNPILSEKSTRRIIIASQYRKSGKANAVNILYSAWKCKIVVGFEDTRILECLYLINYLKNM